tara:strand:- start:232 stop:513 length:282 start_codon:yes stop_codon:yes gene_type:complete
MSDELGWRGKRVKHVDGREGKIRREFPGFCHVGLFIIDDDGGTAFVELNSNGPDTGESGWSWMMAHDGEPDRWAWLGDHNNSLRDQRKLKEGK